MILINRSLLKKKGFGVCINLMNNLFLELYRTLNIQEQLSITGASLVKSTKKSFKKSELLNRDHTQNQIPQYLMNVVLLKIKV